MQDKKTILTLITAIATIDFSTLWCKVDTRLSTSGRHYLYTRLGHPTRTSLEAKLSAIGQVQFTLSANDILAIYYSLSLLFVENDEIIILSTREQFKNMMRRIFEGQQMGLKLHYSTNTEDALNKITPQSKLIIAERVQPSPDGFSIFEHSKVYEASKSKNIIFALDMSNCIGDIKQLHKISDVDLLIADLTYFNGCDGVRNGAMMTDRQDLYEKVKVNVNSIGNVTQPMAAYLASRGLKTLSIRLDQQAKNAEAIVEQFLKPNDIQSHLYGNMILIPCTLDNDLLSELKEIRLKQGNSNFSHIEKSERYFVVHVGIDEYEDIAKELLTMISKIQSANDQQKL
ncbi:cystathionine gamma-synthase [Stylonychia lemnae]|uniref:Cystathionine gamma-synthase n=1 Tax=Stylonychia lemnae TaxID=5949 RepID=A0A077ZV11_STYLE|nr:cystathionine gamma-synthase [Stylonychia lemnae]|eukprot:CDW73730.1 cystathionine gamma-synthase [Stylonychia lemnae]